MLAGAKPIRAEARFERRSHMARWIHPAGPEELGNCFHYA